MFGIKRLKKETEKHADHIKSIYLELRNIKCKNAISNTNIKDIKCSIFPLIAEKYKGNFLYYYDEHWDMTFFKMIDDLKPTIVNGFIDKKKAYDTYKAKE